MPPDLRQQARDARLYLALGALFFFVALGLLAVLAGRPAVSTGDELAPYLVFTVVSASATLVLGARGLWLAVAPARAAFYRARNIDRALWRFTPRRVALFLLLTAALTALVHFSILATYSATKRRYDYVIVPDGTELTFISVESARGAIDKTILWPRAWLHQDRVAWYKRWAQDDIHARTLERLKFSGWTEAYLAESAARLERACSLLAAQPFGPVPAAAATLQQNAPYLTMTASPAVAGTIDYHFNFTRSGDPAFQLYTNDPVRLLEHEGLWVVQRQSERGFGVSYAIDSVRHCVLNRSESFPPKHLRYTPPPTMFRHLWVCLLAIALAAATLLVLPCFLTFRKNPTTPQP